MRTKSILLLIAPFFAKAIKRTKKTIAIVLALLFTNLLYSQHALVNKDTVNYYGTTDTADYMPVLINTNGNIVVSGNQKVSATQYDATTAEQSVNAVNTWVNSFNASNEKAFITCSVNDSGGNIYSAGAIRTPTSNGLEMLLIKRNSSGALVWVFYYDGPGQMNDVVSAICVDGADNVYITGVSDGGFPNLMDYVTIKIHKTTGTKIWDARYNYNNVFDVPTSIIFEASTNRIVVSGSSGNTPLDFDFATISYDMNSGAQVHEERIPNSGGVGEDKILGMVTDAQGNVYVAGTSFDGNNFNAQLVKLDTSLAVVYTRTLDFNGFDDTAIGVALDDSSNVVIVGTSHYSTANREMFIAKYSGNGNLKWKIRRKADPNSNSDAEAVRIFAKNDNELFVGCNFTIGGNQNLALLRFNRHGAVTMEQAYDGASNGREQFMDMTINNDKIFVSARSFNGTNDDNILITYTYKDYPVTPVTNTVTDSYFVKDEVIVRFNKAALKMNTINNRDISFGDLSDFVNDSTCDKIKVLLDPIREFDLDANKIPTRRLDFVFAENDTLSLSRLGDYVPVPQFYASLILTLPSNINTEDAALNLGSIKPDLSWSQLNNLYTFDWVPNDTLYPDKQTSLHTSTLYPDAHINVEKAWDYTTGEPHVRTGIYDTGIEVYGNVDLAGITEEHDFTNGVPLAFAPDYFGHGTQVAGIIGAKSNNTNGVSGIASGGNNSNGVTVVVMKIGNGIMASDAFIKAAYNVGATGSNVHQCAALHIMNSSFGKKNEAVSPELIEGVEYANQNGVAFVASRGNYVVSKPFPINSSNQPATLLPRITMNVGASGTDGNNHVDGVNGSQFTTFRGKGIDFMAPGAINNVYTPYNYNQGAPGPMATSSLAPNSYTSFGGTSSAAPHVSGVVSLMMSYRNQSTPYWDNLAHEDCEAILKRSATDATVATPYYQLVGYDTISGYGKINADSALSALQPQYRIRHINIGHHSTSSSTSTNVIASNVVRYWPGSAVFGAGNYSVDIIEYQVQYTYNFSNDVYIDAWPLHKASNGHPAPTLTSLGNENYYSEIVSATTTGATLKTYAYRFNFKASPPYSNLGGLITPPVNTLKAAFSLYTIGQPDPVGVKDQKETGVDYFNVYPNPSNGNFTIGFSSKNAVTGCLKVVNIMGSIVYEHLALPVANGINRIDLTLAHLPRGIYFINLDIEGNKTLVKKIIIH